MPDAALELVVQRLVVRAVDAHELVDAVGVERAHLRLEARARRRAAISSASGISRSSTVSRRMPHRGEDDRAGVDDGAVEVEEDDRKAHRLDRSERRAPRCVRAG